MYSQNNEEAVILEAVAQLGLTTGNFLEIGAFDGKTFSNTMRLIELGWSGLCAEPSPSAFVRLLKQHGDNPKIKLLNAAIGLRSSVVDFWDSGGDGISTTSVDHKDKWEASHKTNFKRIFVYTIPLTTVLAQFGFAYDFINIDVENTNWELFSSLPFSLLTSTRLICVEHDEHFDEMIKLSGRYGFKPQHINSENLILVK